MTIPDTWWTHFHLGLDPNIRWRYSGVVGRGRCGEERYTGGGGAQGLDIPMLPVHPRQKAESDPISGRTGWSLGPQCSTSSGTKRGEEF